MRYYVTAAVAMAAVVVSQRLVMNPFVCQRPRCIVGRRHLLSSNPGWFYHPACFFFVNELVVHYAKLVLPLLLPLLLLLLLLLMANYY